MTIESIGGEPSVGGRETFRLDTTPARSVLDDLLANAVIYDATWDALSSGIRGEIESSKTAVELLRLLLEHGLLTQHQANHVLGGKTDALVLGNYRIVDSLGAGATSHVFKARHSLTGRLVAIKVFAVDNNKILADQDLRRFRSEIRVIAHLQHPNIVRVIDADEQPATPNRRAVVFYVMEYVEGRDLDKVVLEHGPLSLERACDLAYQIGSALGELHQRGLVHRDIKPSNVLVNPAFEAKLLDFGVVLQQSQRMTQAGSILGTLDYLAPEQAENAAAVDIRADIYSLGGVLYWCLTGQPPFPPAENLVLSLLRRQNQLPPSVRRLRPELPALLDGVVARMMATRPEERYRTPEDALAALLPFAGRTRPLEVASSSTSRVDSVREPDRVFRVVIADDDPAIRSLVQVLLSRDGVECTAAENGAKALMLVKTQPFDLLLTDWMMPELSGLDLCRRIRDDESLARMRIVVISSVASDESIAEMLDAGADDYLIKPFSPVQLRARVRTALRLRLAQEQIEQSNLRLRLMNEHLQRDLAQREWSVANATDVLLSCLATFSTFRDAEEEEHLTRIRKGSRLLAELAAERTAFIGQIDKEFVDRIERCAPTHDLGKAGLPDYILLKPGGYDDAERFVMETHTTVGAEFLTGLVSKFTSGVEDLKMAIDIARSHHERFDGEGYPDRLAGTEIPLSARIVTIIDTYDALRSRHVNKPALQHRAALKIMESSAAQFDPDLFTIFRDHADSFSRLYEDTFRLPRLESR